MSKEELEALDLSTPRLNSSEPSDVRQFSFPGFIGEEVDAIGRMPHPDRLALEGSICALFAIGFVAGLLCIFAKY
jgi:hypothetical protein